MNKSVTWLGEQHADLIIGYILVTFELALFKETGFFKTGFFKKFWLVKTCGYGFTVPYLQAWARLMTSKGN